MKSGKLISAMALLVALAMTQPSEARIVYTPTHVKVDSPYNLDLNHDGITDFTIQQYHVVTHICPGEPGYLVELVVTPAQGSGEVVSATGFAAALGRGVKIGSNQSFDSRLVDMAYVVSGRFALCIPHHYIVGDWVNVSNRYLGLSFQIKGKTHYGWARLSVQVGYVYIHATLTGFAYEDIAGKSIIAGKTHAKADEWDEEGFGTGASVISPTLQTPHPETIGMLALVAQGVPLWRRKEWVGCTSENN